MGQVDPKKIAQSQIMQTPTQWMQTMLSKGVSRLTAALDIKRTDRKLRVAMGNIIPPYIKLLAITSSTSYKPIIVASCTENTEEIRFPADFIITMPTVLQYHIATPYEFDLLIVQMEKDVVAELLDWDLVDGIQTDDGEYNTKIPIREWARLVTDDIPHTRFNLIAIDACRQQSNNAAQSQLHQCIPPMAIKPVRMVMLCGQTESYSKDNTSANMRLFNSTELVQLPSMPQMTIGSFGCCTQVTIGDDPAVQIVLRRFDTFSKYQRKTYSELECSRRVTLPIRVGESEEPVAYIVNGDCTCCLCKLMRTQDGGLMVPGVKAEDILNAIAKDRSKLSPFEELLAFILHRVCTFNKVGKIDSAALRLLLQRVNLDYISLRVNGLVPVQSTQELLVDSWEESSNNLICSCTALAALDKKDWYLIGTQRPILVLEDHIVNRFPMQSDGNWFYTASPLYKKTHAVVYRKGSNSVMDIRSFVRILSGEERVYRHIDKIYTHASTHAKITTESDYSPLPYNASLPDLDLDHVRIDIPLLPKIISFEHVFVNYTFTGIKAKASNATFFIRNIRK
jgi:hypothetical protein